MIDAKVLKSLGWSDELIQSAVQVAETVAEAAVVDSADSVIVDATASTTVGSQGADVSGPPVAQPHLRFDR